MGLVDKQTDLIDDAYQNYLDNFVEPKCPETLDVQPDYYLPMSKEWFEKSLYGNHYRSVGRYGITNQFDVTIETRELSLEERIKLNGFLNESDIVLQLPSNLGYVENKLKENNIPTKLTIINYNGQTQEIYE